MNLEFVFVPERINEALFFAAGFFSGISFLPLLLSIDHAFKLKIRGG